MFPAVGGDGMAFTVATVVAAVDVQPPTVTVTLYVPDAAVVAFGIVGFCWLDVKALGPVHEYVAPVTVEAVRLRVWPAQMGPLLPAVGADGMALTVAFVVAAVDVHPLTVTVTLYVPVAAVVAFGIDGFCWLDVKPLGPIHEYVAPLTVDAVRSSV